MANLWKAVVTVKRPIPEEVIEPTGTLRYRRRCRRYVQPRKAGEITGLCPFHSKRPSFSVSPRSRSITASAAGRGNAKFIMEMEHNSGSCSPPGGGGGTPQAGTISDLEDGPRKRMREALEWACRLYHHILLNTIRADVPFQSACRWKRSRNSGGLCSFLRRYSPPLSERKGFGKTEEAV